MRQIVLVSAICILAANSARAADSASQWTALGRDAGGSQYSPLAIVNKANVAGLKLAWQHRSGDLVAGPSPTGTSYGVTPLHANNTIY